jgi:ABC-type Mn2+/Zn2+ transport system permease subunit
VSTIVGLYVSFYGNVASGAAIVLIETVLFAIALVFSPRSGVLTSRRSARVP